MQRLIKIEKSLLDKEIVIFGCGEYGKLTLVALRSLSYSPKYFIDNDQSKWDQQLNGLSIKNPINILEELHSNIVVLVASVYSGEIAMQLEQMGFQNNKDFYLLNRREVNYNATRPRIINGVSVGRYSFGVEKHCYSGCKIESIGSFCSIHEDVVLGAGNHPISLISTHPMLYKDKNHLCGHDHVPVGILDKYNRPYLKEISKYCKNDKIIIGNDVWIGAGVVVMPSVKIGNGAIIGANAVVTTDIPDYAIAIGVPAKVLRYRFSESEIDILNHTKWWNWTDEEIAESSHLLTDPSLFFEKYKKRVEDN